MRLSDEEIDDLLGRAVIVAERTTLPLSTVTESLLRLTGFMAERDTLLDVAKAAWDYLVVIDGSGTVEKYSYREALERAVRLWGGAA